jgi:hypothetical protein
MIGESPGWSRLTWASRSTSITISAEAIVDKLPPKTAKQIRKKVVSRSRRSRGRRSRVFSRWLSAVCNEPDGAQCKWRSIEILDGDVN